MARVQAMTLVATLSGMLVQACVSAPKVEIRPEVMSRNGAARDTSAVRAALAKSLVVSDSAMVGRVVFRSDTAWAMVPADSLFANRARVERRNGVWVFVRFDGTAVR